MLSIWLVPVEIKNAAAPFEFKIKSKVYYSAWVSLLENVLFS